ncbi:MAG: cupredoxin domain-containing protein [Bdellovibrionaceae bacterium]|nr:cupredoxin domain-containing protein [Pseudobdellovibrionaceae bacterium]
MKAAILALILMILGPAAWAKTVKVKVTKKGFEPARIETKAGEELTLKITRKVKATCAKDITVPSMDIQKPLPLNETVTVTLKPTQKGEVIFGCAMQQMLGGLIIVK